MKTSWACGRLRRCCGLYSTAMAVSDFGQRPSAPRQPDATRSVPAVVFDNAPPYHLGSIARVRSEIRQMNRARESHVEAMAQMARIKAAGRA